jgi:outer membrane protein assembly factor BamB
VRLIAAGFVLAIGIVRWFTITGDHAIVNLLTVLFGFLACLTLLVWFLFFSGYSRLFRFASVAGLFVALVVSSRLVRVDQVSGELVPVFRPSWSKRADETLAPARPAEPGAVADLATVTSDDFPQFLGPQRNNRLDNVELSKDWTSNPPDKGKLWRQPIGAGWSAFAVVNGFAVTLEQRGPEELVTCYDSATGRLIWSHATKTRHYTVPGGIGPRSTPTIHGGRVYALGATGEFVCLQGDTGSVLWRTNLLDRYHVPPGEDEKGVAWGRAGSPLMVDDLVVVPAGGPQKGPWVSLAAFHRETGELVWEGGDQQVSYSSPVLTTIGGVRQIVCVHEKSVAGHDPASGKVLWSMEWPGNSTQDASVSQPVLVGEDRLLLSKGYGRGAALVQLSVQEGGAYSFADIWRDTSLLKTKFTNVVLYQGHVYGLSDGILECVELNSGKRQWKKGRFGQGQILGVRDLLLVQAESGEVVMLSATPTGYDELGRFAAIEGITWNNLSLYGKRLLVRNAEEAAAYELP